MILSEVPLGYLESYCYFLYYLCLIPFKPKRKAEGLIILTSNWKQKALCLSLHSLGLVHIFRRILAVSQQSIFSQPLVVFRFASFLLEFAMALLWSYSFWRKKTALESFIYYSSHNTLVNSRIFKVKKVLMLTLPILLTSFTVSSDFQDEIYFEKLLTSFAHISPIESSSKPDLQYVLPVIQSIAHCFISLLNSAFDVLAVVISVSVYEFTTQQFNCAVRQLEQMSETNYSEIVGTTRKLQMYFSALNGFNSSFFFCWFCMGLPWLPSRLVENIPIGENKGSLLVTLYTLGCFTVYIIGTVLYAEARDKVDRFQVLVSKKIIEDPLVDHTTGNNVIKFIEVSLQDAIVQGGRFLRVNYSFLGSVLSTLIGYGFLVLQFRISSTALTTKEH